MTKHIVFGAAGCGKTYYLVNLVMPELFSQGYRPEDICFCSFTKAAAHEAKDRTIRVFNFKEDHLIYFATIHSICFKRLCMGKPVMSPKLRKKFFEEYNVDYIPLDDDEDLLTNEVSAGQHSVGNVLLSFYDKLRLQYCKSITGFTEKEIEAKFFELNCNPSDYQYLFGSTTINTYDLLKKYEEFKYKNDAIDFIDMLLLAYKTQFVIPAKILIIDEFQDLSPLQYEIYKLWCRGKDKIYIAGDDNQAIFGFQQASAKFLLYEKEHLDKAHGDTELILPMTYRMKKNIHNYCQEYVKHIDEKNRVVKEVKAFHEGGEIIEEYIDEDLERTIEFIRPDKFTYILFRTNYYKKVFIEEVLIPRGIVYFEIRGSSIWNTRTINLFNACVKLIKKQPLSLLETKYFIENTIYKMGLLRRGAKADFKAQKMLKEQYDLADLLALGFNPRLLKLLDSEESLYTNLDLSEHIKKSFQAAPKKIIEMPIRIKIGTIHSSKGKEADDVILFKDISRRIANEISSNRENYEAEIRVFYVGQSRPKERLVVLRNGFKNSECDTIP